MTARTADAHERATGWTASHELACGRGNGCRTGRRCEVAALPGALYPRDPGINQPGAAGNINRRGISRS